MEEDIIVMKHETLAVISVFLLFHEVWLIDYPQISLFSSTCMQKFLFLCKEYSPYQNQGKRKHPRSEDVYTLYHKYLFNSADVSRLPLGMVKPEGSYHVTAFFCPCKDEGIGCFPDRKASDYVDRIVNHTAGQPLEKVGCDEQCGSHSQEGQNLYGKGPSLTAGAFQGKGYIAPVRSNNPVKIDFIIDDDGHFRHPGKI